MYYSNGNYEAFARPEKPEGIEKKHAVIIGGGLAGLSAACFLVRDAQMPGENITVMEDMPVAGGACDGILNIDKGFIIRGGREMENHFECLWDLFRSIPSIETEGVSVLDEYYWLNKHDPNYSLCRVTEKRGKDAHTDGEFGLSDAACMEIMKLFFMKDEDLYGKAINEIWTDEVFNSNFWTYWRTMFAFKDEHSALEVKKYVQRFIHHIGGLPTLKALKFTKYNQYESMILPMIKYLRGHGVKFMFSTTGTNVIFDINHARKVATKIEYLEKGEPKSMDIDENTLVFFTNGSNCSNATIGDHHTAPGFDTSVGDSWKMWQNIARQDPSFGHPDEFLKDPELTQWESATLTTLDEEIIPYMEAICKRDVRSGKVATGGIVTARDSGWLMSWTVNRQPHFKVQPKDQCVVWPVHQPHGRLCQEAHARLHRRRDRPRVAVPYRRARGAHRRAGCKELQLRACYDAQSHHLLHLPQKGRPSRRRPQRRCQLRFPRQPRRDLPRHRVHHRVLRAYRDGSRLHALPCRPRRARGVQLRL